MIKPDRNVIWTQKTQILSMLMAFVLLILLIQLWLITIAFEEFLGSKASLAIPTFLASLGCLALNLRVLKQVNDIDKKD